jgi:hypothetical protein
VRRALAERFAKTLMDLIKSSASASSSEMMTAEHVIKNEIKLSSTSSLTVNLADMKHSARFLAKEFKQCMFNSYLISWILNPSWLDPFSSIESKQCHPPTIFTIITIHVLCRCLQELLT